MTAVPAEGRYEFVVQDATGNTAKVSFPAITSSDISASTETLAQLYTAASTLATDLAACINGKVVKSGLSYEWSKAQKPNGPLNQYGLVQQRLMFTMGDGMYEKTRISLPTPTLTVIAADGVHPNYTATPLSTLIGDIETLCYSSSGHLFNEYLGGKMVLGKPRRRVNQYNTDA